MATSAAIRTSISVSESRLDASPDASVIVPRRSRTGVSLGAAIAAPFAVTRQPACRVGGRIVAPRAAAGITPSGGCAAAAAPYGRAHRMTIPTASRPAAGTQMANWSARTLLVAAAAALIGGALWYARAATVPLIVAALVSTQLVPLVQWMVRRGLARGAA